MRTIFFLVRKEFIQIFRNKGILPLIFLMPVVQLLVLSYAADFEIKNVKILWVDQDQSHKSRELFRKLDASDYFMISSVSTDASTVDESLDKSLVDLAITIPEGFQEGIQKERYASIQLVANAIDGTKAGLGTFYFSQILRSFNADLNTDLYTKNPRGSSGFKRIEDTHSFWFNPYLNYKTFMVPGILVLLVTMIGVFISSMNIVREKELGTIEQLNVTPIKKHQFILGKLIPLWILGLVEFTIGLVVARLVFGIPIVGSLVLLYSFTAMYLIMVLGLGMFVSTVTDTQQQAMFISWFFLVIFILMSGVFTPIENMPDWAQQITLINPVRYFIEVIRMVMLKGSALADIQFQFLVVTGYAILINALAIWRYRKVA